jgi:hypothetical protein
VRRFESYWGHLPLPGHMVADVGICRIASLTGMQPDAARCGSVSRFPEHIRNDRKFTGPAQAHQALTTATAMPVDAALLAGGEVMTFMSCATAFSPLSPICTQPVAGQDLDGPGRC